MGPIVHSLVNVVSTPQASAVRTVWLDISSAT
jgi:hypothetical protein